MSNNVDASEAAFGDNVLKGVGNEISPLIDELNVSSSQNNTFDPSSRSNRNGDKHNYFKPLLYFLGCDHYFLCENDKIKSIDKFNLINSTGIVLIEGPINILLILLPFSIWGYLYNWSDIFTFITALLCLAPLSERLGYCTEQLAFHTNPTIGGLLNASFGNIAELIIAIFALRKKYYQLVQLSLLGSILSNSLLVLGSAFVGGGLKYHTQEYSLISSRIFSGLLIVSTMGITFPTLLTYLGSESTLGNTSFSRMISVIQIVLYVLFLYFQLISHEFLFAEKKSGANDNQTSITAVTNSEVSETKSNESKNNNVEEDDKIGLLESQNTDISNNDNDMINTSTEIEEDEVELGFIDALVWMAIIMIFIAILAEEISSSIQNASDSIGIPSAFTAAIILPIVGNAAEHTGAVMFAMKNNLDLSLGIALGSATQIAIFVFPLTIIISWCMNSSLTYDLGGYETCTLILAVFLMAVVIKDGTSNYMVGVVLLAAYAIIATGYYVLNDSNLTV
eukprot:gene13742-18432_t